MARFGVRNLNVKKLPRVRGKIFSILIGSCALVSVLFFLMIAALTYEGMRITSSEKPSPFPLGVDPELGVITELEHVDTFLETGDIPPSLASKNKNSWFTVGFAKLTQLNFLQNLASPSGRLLVILPGERREEIAARFGKLLKWDNVEKERFLTLVASSSPELLDGKYTPSKYLTSDEATPEMVADLIIKRFNEEIASRYSDDIAEKVPLEDALIIASLLEREAYDFEDMRYISGIIWNRRFVGMKLQLDATLQYAKGTKSPSSWWPRPVPADKYIASAYNTYIHEDLPPAPIANPSIDAILAALNPRKTDCMFYFHDRKSQFHCAETYEGHVELLKKHYGQGR